MSKANVVHGIAKDLRMTTIHHKANGLNMIVAESLDSSECDLRVSGAYWLD